MTEQKEYLMKMPKLDPDAFTQWSTILAGCIFMIICALIGCLLLGGCTISFQNISTHGTATDLVDEDQKADGNISPNLQIPLKGL